MLRQAQFSVACCLKESYISRSVSRKKKCSEREKSVTILIYYSLKLYTTKWLCLLADIQTEAYLFSCQKVLIAPCSWLVGVLVRYLDMALM